MSISNLLSQTVTIVRLSQATHTADEEGVTTTTPSEVDYPGLIQQQDTKEVQVGPDILTSDHIIFLGPDAVVDGRDQVRESGRLFEILGAPDVVRTPRGPHHIEANLRRVTT